MVRLSENKKSVIVEKSGLSCSFNTADLSLSKKEFSSKYKKALGGYTTQVFAEMQPLKKGLKK